jgi:hypothetical protein
LIVCHDTKLANTAGPENPVLAKMKLPILFVSLNRAFILLYFSLNKIFMDHKQDLEDLNRQALDKFHAYVKMKDKLREEDHKKLHAAKEEWQTAWNKLKDVLMVLERLEI